MITCICPSSGQVIFVKKISLPSAVRRRMQYLCHSILSAFKDISMTGISAVQCIESIALFFMKWNISFSITQETRWTSFEPCKVALKVKLISTPCFNYELISVFKCISWLTHKVSPLQPPPGVITALMTAFVKWAQRQLLVLVLLKGQQHCWKAICPVRFENSAFK